MSTTSPRSICVGGVIAVFALLLTGPAEAQEESPTGWTTTTEFSLALTAGNASSSSLGFRNTTGYRWPSASLQLSAGGIRTESEVTTRTATGTVEDFEIVEQTETEVTAEHYYARGRYDRSVSESMFLFGGAGWERNTFAGIQNRTALVGGAGRTWFDQEDSRLKTDLGFTYTLEDPVVEDPGTEESFAGLRGTVDLRQRLTTTTLLTSTLLVDENLNETSDLRADWTTSVAVAISSNLALKTSYQMFFDNDPALIAVPLGDRQVLTPLEKVDSIFTAAIVVEF